MVNRVSLVTQHIITIVVVLLLVIIDVYVKIQRLNYSTFNIDAKIQKVIDTFDPEKISDKDEDTEDIFTRLFQN